VEVILKLERTAVRRSLHRMVRPNRLRGETQVQESHTTGAAAPLRLAAVEAEEALRESPELQVALRIDPMVARQRLGAVIYAQQHRCGTNSERQRRRTP
jgi:hypothetical protein